MTARRRDRGQPIDRVIAVGVRINPLQRRTRAVRRERPWVAIVIADRVHGVIWNTIGCGNVRRLELEVFAAVLQPTGCVLKDLHRGWNSEARSKRSRIIIHQQNEPMGWNGDVSRESEPQAVEFTGVGWIGRVIEWDIASARVFQLQKLVDVGTGMVIDFVDHNRFDSRPCIRSAKSPRRLQWELLLTDAIDVTSERNSVLRGAKREPMAVTGQLACRIGRKEIDVIAE